MKANPKSTSLAPSVHFTPTVLAVVGMSGSGKSLVVDYLAEKAGGIMVYFGGVVIEEIEKRGLPVTEENEASVRLELRREFGMAVMAMKSLSKIEEIIAKDRPVIIDGLYSYSEFTFLRKIFGDRLIVVAVHAPRDLRIERLSRRPVRPLTLQEVNIRDKREVEDLEKAQPIALADIHVVNCSSPKRLFRYLNKCVMPLVLAREAPERKR
jgi:dephospho-CoA kinase